MFPVTFNAESVYLLPYLEAWGKVPQLTLSLPTENSRAAEAVETRRAHADHLVASYNFTLTLSQESRAEITAALRVLGNKRILCPFWRSYQLASAVSLPPLSTGIWLIAEQDLSDWEVNTTGTASGFTPTASAFRVPLMLGYFAQTPTPELFDPTVTTFDVKFQEAGDATYALSSPASDASSGPTLANGVTPKLFPAPPDWATAPAAGNATVEISRQPLGFGREPAEIYYPQSSARPLKIGVTLQTDAALASLVAFFQKRQADVESFWIPGALNETSLTANTSAGSAVIHVDNAAPFVAGDYIAFIDSTTEIRKIASVDADANTLTLTSNPSLHYASSTRIVAAILARFKRPELKLTFPDIDCAQAVIDFVEVPKEYADDSGETIGVTHGALPRRAYLYRFTRRYPGGLLTNRYTSDARSIVIASGDAAGTYAKDKSIHFSHKQVLDTLDFENASVELESRVFTGNPLLLLLPNQLESPLYCEIFECFPDSSNNAATATSKWYGKVVKPSFSGPIITASVVHILSALGRNVPTFFEQPTCNWKLYGTPCGIVEDDFTSAGTIVSISGNEITVAVSGTFAAGYFAFGRIWCGSAGTYQSRSIYNSTATSAGNVTLTIDAPLDGVSVSGSVSFSPGCGKTVDDCTTKFDNYVRFGASPFIPVGNPSLVKVVQNTTSGGKK